MSCLKNQTSFSLWLTVCYLACCLFKKKSPPKKYDNVIPLQSLQAHFASSKTDLPLNIVTCQEVISSVGFWLILTMFFLYGGLLLNFLLFMKLYLTSQLGWTQHNHISLIFNMFLVSFMIGRVVIILISSLIGFRSKLAKKSENRRINFWFLIKNTFLLFLTISLLAIVSTVQLYSSSNTFSLDSIHNSTNFISGN